MVAESSEMAMPHLLRSHSPDVTALPLPEEPDEATLVARAKADRRAFAPLYHRYIAPVYRYCNRCLGDRQQAEDATSLIFTKALAAIATCRDDAFRSWLFAIAHNVIVDARRRQVVSRPLEEAAAMADGASERSPEQQALAGDDARTIRTLLGHLSPDQRQMLELRLAGLSDAEIARVLGRSHGAVRTSQYRAIARLRALVGAAEPPWETDHGAR
jgi:RNA polymerase sigma-70 factor (ECF subfamily)